MRLQHNRRMIRLSIENPSGGGAGFGKSRRDPLLVVEIAPAHKIDRFLDHTDISAWKTRFAQERREGNAIAYQRCWMSSRAHSPERCVFVCQPPHASIAADGEHASALVGLSRCNIEFDIYQHCCVGIWLGDMSSGWR